MGLATFFSCLSLSVGIDHLSSLVVNLVRMKAEWLLYKCYASSYLKCKHAFADYFGFYFIVDCRLHIVN
jgi:hypothetical protein